MTTKSAIRLAVLLAIGAAAYYFVTSGVQQDMSKKQQSMERAISNSNRDVPTAP